MAGEKEVVVSFRVDAHLAELLRHLPDKSSFIRDAILRRLYDVCPLCRGRGVLPGIVARWWSRKIGRTRTVRCACCRYDYPEELVAESPPGESGRRKRRRHPDTGGYICPHCSAHEHQH